MAAPANSPDSPPSGPHPSGPRDGGAPDWVVLARYLAGESPAGEAERVRSWLAAHPGDLELIEALDGTSRSLGVINEGSVDVEAALERVRPRLHQPDVVPLTDRPGRRSQSHRRRAGWRLGSAIAAGIGAIAIGTLTWQFAQNRSVADTFVERSYESAVGERESIRLPDGSSVVLAPGSTLLLSAGYPREDRNVELTGEAYFDVAAGNDRPFTVRAGRAVVVDIGTAFSIRAREHSELRVVVTSGAVLLRSAAGGDTGVVLREGDAGSISSDVARADRGGATEYDIAWRDGRLIFRDAPLSDVRDELRRWYGVELRIGDSALARRRLTAAFDGESRSAVLDIIAQTLGASVDVRGDTAHIRAGR